MRAWPIIPTLRGYEHNIDLVAFLALMVGVLVVAAGLLRLGWIADFLSTPVTTGVLAGIAVDILVRQLPAIFGVTPGGTTTSGRLRAIGENIGHVNGWSLAIGALVGPALTVASLCVAQTAAAERSPIRSGSFRGDPSPWVFTAGNARGGETPEPGCQPRN